MPYLRTLAPLLALSMIGCKGEEPPVEPCVAVADAGADSAAPVGSAFTLTAGESASCGTFAGRFVWTFLATPDGSGVESAGFGSSNGTSQAGSVEFTPDRPGTYVIGLTVVDDAGESNQDVVVITASGGAGAAPTAAAGDDASGRVGLRVELDGSASSDPDGDDLRYSWTFASVPAGSALGAGDLFDAQTVGPSFIPDADGVYLLGLVVSDGVFASDIDFVAVDVSPDNAPPVAEAGEPFAAAPCSDGRLVLDGNGSWDADGDPLTWRWGVASVPSGSTATADDFDDPGSPTPAFFWDVPGQYGFWLEVSDGVTTSPKDLVLVDASSLDDNATPTPFAGDDFTFNLDASCTPEAAGGVCGPCPAITYELDSAGSTDPDGDALALQWSLVSGAGATLADPFAGATELSYPSQPAILRTVQTTTITVRLDATDCATTGSDEVVVTIKCEGKVN